MSTRKRGRSRSTSPVPPRVARATAVATKGEEGVTLASPIFSLPKDVFNFSLRYVPSAIPKEVLARSSRVSKAWSNLVKEELERRKKPFVVVSYEISRWNGPEEERRQRFVIFNGFSKEHAAQDIIRNWPTKWAEKLGYANQLRAENDPSLKGGIRAPKLYKDPIGRIYARMQALREELLRPIPRRTLQRLLGGPFSSERTAFDEEAGHWEAKLESAIRGLGKYEKGEWHRLRIAVPVVYVPHLSPFRDPTEAASNSALTHVFRYLDAAGIYAFSNFPKFVEDILVCRHVCREWNKAVLSAAGRARVRQLVAQKNSTLIIDAYNFGYWGKEGEQELDHRYMVFSEVTSEAHVAWLFATDENWRERLDDLWRVRPLGVVPPPRFGGFLAPAIDTWALVQGAVWSERSEATRSEEEKANVLLEKQKNRFALIGQRCRARRAACRRMPAKDYVAQQKTVLRNLLRAQLPDDALEAVAEEGGEYGLTQFAGISEDRLDPLQEWLVWSTIYPSRWRWHVV